MDNVTKAEVLWYNEAKKYGLARSADIKIDDIKIELSSLVDQDRLPKRGNRIELTFTETSIGPVARRASVKIVPVATGTTQHLIQPSKDSSRQAESGWFDNLFELAELMPKVELHVHLEGTISPATLLAISRKNNYPLPARDEAGLSKVLRFRDFAHFIDMYSLCANALQTSEDYYTVTYEYLRFASQQRIQYVEAYFSPYDRMRFVKFEDIVAGVSQARDDALADFGVQVDFVVDVGRHLLWGQDKNPELAHDESIRLAELAIKAKNQDVGIIGFSIGGKEIGYPVFPFVDAFNLACQNGLHIKAHAGEAAGPEDVWNVIGLLKVERIGHAVRAWEDKSLVRHIASHKIPLEMCVSGNLLTGSVEDPSSHPFPDCLEQGIPVVLGSDDPSLFGTDLTKEYQYVIQEFGVTVEGLKKLALDAIEFSWICDEKKKRLRESFEEEFAQLRRKIGI